MRPISAARPRIGLCSPPSPRYVNHFSGEYDSPVFFGRGNSRTIISYTFSLLLIVLLFRSVDEYHNIVMPSEIHAFLCLVLAGSLGHVVIVTALPIADESLDAALETGPETNAVENENLERKVVEYLVKDKRQGPSGARGGQPGPQGEPGQAGEDKGPSGGRSGPSGLLNEEDKRWGPEGRPEGPGGPTGHLNVEDKRWGPEGRPEGPGGPTGLLNEEYKRKDGYTPRIFD